MNAFKRQLRNHGVKLEQDYPCIPYADGDGSVVVLGISVNPEQLSVTYYYNVINITDYYDKSFNIVKQEYD